MALDGGISLSTALTSPLSRARPLKKAWSPRESQTCPTSPTAALKATAAVTKVTRRAPAAVPFHHDQQTVSTAASPWRWPLPRDDGGSGGGTGDGVQQHLKPASDYKKTVGNGSLSAYPFTGAPIPADRVACAELAVRVRPPLPPPKRQRAVHDVDGPGTGSLPCKKRRLRLHLITSRLSQPYSLPATHILNRESSGESALTRFLRRLNAAKVKKAGHQTALVRKAAILNRVRISVRQAAVQRGHVHMAGLAARQNALALDHGLLVVTAPETSATAARFPGCPGGAGPGVPNAWRPHTTTFPTAPSLLSPSPPGPMYGVSGPGVEKKGEATQPLRQPPAPAYSPSRGLEEHERAVAPQSSICSPVPGDDGDEDEGAFPGSDLDGRYAELSDDDMDDVYADFGVLFGGGGGSSSSSSEEHRATGCSEGVDSSSKHREGQGRGGGEEQGEHFYEEYLDELDGIPWVI
ncbi:hypothetical protein DL764_007625 [Monosporascus ibericus]|uniref:Uncharacterized protein n=1 Tax=Monosporascus ibericus TaxID=155417 RepID=A0A4Q4SZM8_9PEZI|nr:hypothetical protein DL764_007625 [Monosporascus ibericus]